MTVLSERIRAVKNTKHFLFFLANTTRTPALPKTIRERCRDLLKHYPSDDEIERAFLLEANERKEPLY